MIRITPHSAKLADQIRNQAMGSENCVRLEMAPRDAAILADVIEAHCIVVKEGDGYRIAGQRLTPRIEGAKP